MISQERGKTVKPCLTVALLSVVVSVLSGSMAAAQEAGVRASQAPDRVDVVVDGRLFTSYRFARDQKYPYFWPVNGPASGASVTTETSMPYPHHHSLFFGCDRVNGGNYWQEGNERGQILSSGPDIVVASGPYVLITDRCLWKRPGSEPVFEDVRCFLIHAPDKDLRMIDVSIRLKALTDVRILRTNHALFAARMVPELSVNSKGTLVNAAGQKGEKETLGRPSPWCDYSGTRDGVTEGLAILEAPVNPWYPCPWFTRDYGFFSPTPMNWLENDRLDIAKGSEIHLMYRVIVHRGDSVAARIAELHARYAEVFAQHGHKASWYDVIQEKGADRLLLKPFLESARLGAAK